MRIGMGEESGSDCESRVAVSGPVWRGRVMGSYDACERAAGKKTCMMGGGVGWQRGESGQAQAFSHASCALGC